MVEQPEYSSRKEEILDTLEEIFLTEGFRDVTIEDLVRRAHCSRGTLYDLAPTKEALFVLVLDRLWRRIGLRAQAAIHGSDDPVRKIEDYALVSSGLFHPSPRFLEDVEAYAAARRLFDDHVAIAIRFLEKLVADGMESGHFRPAPPRLVAEVLTAAAAQFTGRSHAATDAIREAIRIVLYGMVDEATARAAGVPSLLPKAASKKARRTS